MKIALFGYGKMGREIESIALERNHSVVLKMDSANRASLTPEELRKADVVIEFSTPHTVLGNIHFCLEAGVPVVVGTTGWHNELGQVRELTARHNGALFYASNFSPGVNLFFRLNSYLAQLMNNYPNYEVEIEEIHHIHKLDKPSGTAISIATQIVDKLDRKQGWSTTEAGADQVFIRDLREGEVPGTHSVKYHSAIDDIEIMHKAHNRRGFAMGAVLAAEFLAGKQGVFTMDDLIKA